MGTGGAGRCGVDSTDEASAGDPDAKSGPLLELLHR
jgi:hypothetical protein